MVLLFLLMPHIPIRDRNICIYSTAAAKSALLCHMRNEFDSLLFSAICKCCRVMLMVFFSFVLSRWIGSIVLLFRLMPHVPLEIETCAFIHSTATALSAHQR